MKDFIREAQRQGAKQLADILEQSRLSQSSVQRLQSTDSRSTLNSAHGPKPSAMPFSQAAEIIQQAKASSGAYIDLSRDPIRSKRMSMATDSLQNAGKRTRAASQAWDAVQDAPGEQGIRGRITAADELMRSRSGLEASAQHWINVQKGLEALGFKTTPHDSTARHAIDKIPEPDRQGTTPTLPSNKNNLRLG